MGIYEEIRNYIRNPDFKLVYKSKYLNIINYLKILILEHDKIEIMIPNKVLRIRGINLKLKRLMNKELLITGNINELKMVDI